jgi:sugar (pentulose or hexulose) kinase
LWNQIRADVLGIPLLRVEEQEIAVLGVMRQLATHVNDRALLQQLQDRLSGQHFQPQADSVSQYTFQYELYKRAQQQLRALMHDLKKKSPHMAEKGICHA